MPGENGSGRPAAINGDAVISEVLAAIGKAATADEVLQSAVDAISLSVRCSVALEELGQVTFSCACYRDRDESDSVLSVLNGFSLIGSRTFAHASDFYRSKRKAFKLSDSVAGANVNRVVAPVVSQGRKVAYLSLLRLDHPFSAQEVQLADSASILLAPYIQERRRTNEFESKLATSFVDDLITGSFRTSSPALDYGRELGFDLSSPNWVIVIDILGGEEREYKAPLTPAGHDWKLSILSAVRSSFGEDVAALSVFRNMQVVVIASESVDPSELAAAAVTDLEERFPRFSFMAAIGFLCRSIEDIKPSFEAANRIIRLGRELGGGNRVLSLSQFGTRALLYSAFDPEVMVNFVSECLKELVRSQGEMNNQLLETLAVFLENRGNAHKTARDLNLSSSGLKYRLKKISELTGQNLRDPRTFYDVAIAMDILNLVGRDAVLRG